MYSWSFSIESLETDLRIRSSSKKESNRIILFSGRQHPNDAEICFIGQKYNSHDAKFILQIHETEGGELQEPRQHLPPKHPDDPFQDRVLASPEFCFGYLRFWTIQETSNENECPTIEIALFVGIKNFEYLWSLCTSKSRHAPKQWHLEVIGHSLVVAKNRLGGGYHMEWDGKGSVVVMGWTAEINVGKQA